MSINRIGVFSLGKMLAIIYGGIGLFLGILFAISSIAGGAMLAAYAEELGTGGMGAMVGVGAIIILPLMLAINGFISGVITALLFNFGARFGGGLSVEISGMQKSA